jgi:hypothetical protein
MSSFPYILALPTPIKLSLNLVPLEYQCERSGQSFKGPYSVIFMHRFSVKSCAARGKTKSTYFKAITGLWFV